MLGRGHLRHRFGVTTSTPPFSLTIAASVQQVDGAWARKPPTKRKQRKRSVVTPFSG